MSLKSAATALLVLLSVFACATGLYSQLVHSPAPATHRELAAMSQLAPLVSTQHPYPHRIRIIGYEREQFGTWLPGVRESAVAVVHASGTDPYSGEPLGSDSPIEVDHVLPLSAAWDLGAHSWPKQLRIQFANDPLNLIATAAAENRGKSDSLPSEWMPSDKGSHCWYSRAVATVAARYQLAIPEEDLAVMKRSCLFRELPMIRIG